MKTSLSQLPRDKQEQLAAITKILCDGAPVEKIILFGSYARGDWVEDFETEYFSDYDILVIVKDKGLAEDASLWTALSIQARAVSGNVPVNLIVHDLKSVNRELRKGQYFFTDVLNEGVLLHDAGRHELATSKLPTLTERLTLAQTNFEYWFTSANEFYDDFESNVARSRYPKAAFELHQATERYFVALLLVFTAYKPRTHNIEELCKEAASLHQHLNGALPRNTPEDNRLFLLLKRAYIEARYSKSYRITDEELRILGERVRALAALIERVCREKLASLGGG